jgi:hypothetical protein
MSDTLGAPAPAESTPAPEATVELPNPISTEAQPEPQEKSEPKAKPEPKADKPISTREALEKATAKVEKDNAPVKTEAKPADKAADKAADKTEPVKTDKPRDEAGKFAKDPAKVEAPVKTEAKPSYTAGDPPARFSADAKAVWATLPETVRAETARMERELTQGYEKHKAAAERDSTLNEFHDMAKQAGKDLPSVVREYVNMESLLRKEPVKAMETILSRVGLSPRQYAEHILGQTPDQNASQQDATIRELRQQNATLEERLNRLEGGFNQQRESATLTEINKFAQDNPRFEELAADIAFFMKSGRAKDLPEAYRLAERLNPAPAQASTTAASSAPVIDLSVQTEKGQKSINGAPSPGSSPAAQKPSTSIKEALRKAMAQAG